MSQKSVSVSKLAKLLDLKVFTKELDLKKHKVTLVRCQSAGIAVERIF